MNKFVPEVELQNCSPHQYQYQYGISARALCGRYHLDALSNACKNTCYPSNASVHCMQCTMLDNVKVVCMVSTKGSYVAAFHGWQGGYLNVYSNDWWK